MNKKKVLGRGLSNLIPDTRDLSKQDLNYVLPEVLISKIKINLEQPRKHFSKLEELAESIKSVGILQPIVIRKIDDDFYELISGERRYKACQIAGFDKIPAVVKDISHKDALKLSIIENIQREDLNPIEIAVAYKKIKEEFNISDTELAKELGKNRPTIVNIMRLLFLPESVKDYLKEGKITEGQVRPLVTPYKENILTKEEVETIVKKIIEKKLVSRQIENLVRDLPKSKKEDSTVHFQKSNNELPFEDFEKKLEIKLSTKTQIKHNYKSGKGKIVISYSNLEDMKVVLKNLGIFF